MKGLKRKLPWDNGEEEEEEEEKRSGMVTSKGNVYSNEEGCEDWMGV